VPLLDAAACAILAEDCAALPFRQARPLVGETGREVAQDFEICAAVPPDNPLWAFTADLEALLRAALAPIEPPLLARPLRLNDLVVQRYAAGSSGITPHRDHVRYEGLVAVVTLAGAARFYTCADRAGTAPRERPMPPGSLVLMRAPGFAGRTDRPFHALSDVTEARLSLGLRHDTRGGGA